ncbi:hypothetical protein G7059_07990 [Erysipelothrix sp. HDW6A]|uniref:phage/plasmid primase, P4 family n=1 Tax=Erysipelothrix sp. HDW6A TaxID=2714928 RepID=UPI00140DD38A|nr:phage/plasmid primase, P4 family [Erysipelothrix sp. HDW6A]QIK57782.1 hypothetical protein G7059_07990 [Erysipelothrix sp. HDW6A]
MKYIKIVPGKKTPAHKLTTTFTRKEISDVDDVGMMVEEPYVVVDVDDSEEAEILLNIIRGEGIKARVMKTRRGYHFWFKTSKSIKNNTTAKVGLTLYVDYRSWGIKANGEPKLSYTRIKADGAWFDWELRTPFKNLDELPRWLRPTGSKYLFKGYSDGDGRNQALYEYILTLQSAGYTREEAIETITLINKYVLKDSLKLSELETILRDESFVDEETLETVNGNHESWFTDKGKFLHNVFADMIIKDMQIVTYHARTYVYEDGYYQDTDNDIMLKMMELFPAISMRQRSEVMSYIKIITHVSEPESDEYTINLMNGRYDLRKQRLTPHNSKYMDFSRVNAEYDADAYDEYTHNVLKKVFINDDQLFELFTQILGYSLCKNTIYQQAFFLSGGGSNGKSTILEMVKSLIGYRNVSTLSLTDLEDKFKVAELENKLVNLGDDIPTLTIKDTGKFKKLVSGEGVTVERKNQNPFELNNYATLWFSTNKMPSFGDKSLGMERRITILPFNATFTSKDKDFDPNILEKVTTQSALNYLLRLAIEGYQSLRKSGKFIVPEVVTKANEAYKIESSSILTWLKEGGYSVNELTHEPIVYWYQQYKLWCVEAGYQKPFSRRQFVNEICTYVKLDTKQIRTGYGDDVTGKGSKREYYFVEKAVS